MNYLIAIFIVVLAIFNTGKGFRSTLLPIVRQSQTYVKGYVPDGFTPEQYRAFKAKEAAKKQKNLGRVGPKGFKSRSMQSFQEALEKGEASHLMPMFNAKEKIAKGLIKKEDIPYMQRGGSWDNSDVKGARKKRWLESDQKYAAGGYKREQSVSIFGFGGGLDWTGSKEKSGPRPGEMSIAAPKLTKNYKPPNVYDIKKKRVTKADSENKKFFGLF